MITGLTVPDILFHVRRNKIFTLLLISISNPWDIFPAAIKTRLVELRLKGHLQIPITRNNEGTIFHILSLVATIFCIHSYLYVQHTKRLRTNLMGELFYVFSSSWCILRVRAGHSASCGELAYSPSCPFCELLFCDMTFCVSEYNPFTASNRWTTHSKWPPCAIHWCRNLCLSLSLFLSLVELTRASRTNHSI